MYQIVGPDEIRTLRQIGDPLDLLGCHVGVGGSSYGKMAAGGWPIAINAYYLKLLPILSPEQDVQRV